MNDLPKLYFTMETYLFLMLEEEFGKLTEKMLLRFPESGLRPSNDEGAD